jgi:uncharacterized protein (TIGR02145 family)
MKKLLFVLLVLSVFAVNAQVPSYVPTNGLLAFYPLNANGNDMSGNANNLIPNGNVSYSTNNQGVQNSSCHFKNGNDYFTTPTGSWTLINNLQRGTISFWVKIDSQYISGHYFGIGNSFIVKQKHSVGEDLFFGMQDGTTKIRMQLTGVFPSVSGTDIIGNTSLIPNKWYHVVGVWDGIHHSLYVNGVLDGQINNSNGIANRPLPDYFSIGSILYGGNGSTTFPSGAYGSMDELGIYNRALTQSEITQLYNSNSCIANITTPDTTICRGSSVTLNAAAVNSASVTDINGNVYPTVNIGAQTWMQKNLMVTKYKNGDIIPLGSSGSWGWADPGEGQWGLVNCFPVNDTTANINTYGRSYNWYAVNDTRGIAPEGWRVPDEHDWNVLIKYLDANADTTCKTCYQGLVSGQSLKESGNLHWGANVGATNSSRFTALPGGLIFSGGCGWATPTSFGFWWSKSQFNSTTGFYKRIGYSNSISDSTFFSDITPKSIGLSVRCLKNTPTYLWSTGATTPSITVSPTVTTKYYCTVSDGVNTCKDSVTVTVSSITTNLITADTIKVCGTSTTISATTGLSSYAWSNGASTASTTVTSSGWYKCTASNGPCTVVDSVYVSLFNPKITQNDTTVCAGNALTLNANINTSNGLSTLSQWQNISSQNDFYTRVLKTNAGFYLCGAQTNSRLYKSNDLSNFTPLASPLVSHNLSFGKDKNGVLYFGTGHEGIYRSTDNGNTWNYNVASGYGCGNLDFDFDSSNNLYTGVGGYLRGLYVSNNNGTNWQNTNSGMDFTEIHCVPLINKTFIVTGAYLAVSSNNGQTWSQITGQPFSSNTIMVKHIGNIVFLFTNNGKIYKSTDNTNTWSLYSTFPVVATPSIYLNDAIIDSNGDWWIAINQNGVFHSTNGGLSWTNENIGISGNTNYLLKDSNSILITTSTGIYKKTILSPITYLWSTTATTPSITVTPTATTSYIATVSNGINTCKDTVKITVANITSLSPTTIFGAVDVCAAIGADTASVPVNYKINKVANAASYVWTVPAGATLLSGQGDTSIMVRFSSSFVSGAITVKSVSTCNIASALKSVTVYKRVAAAPTAIQKEFTPTSILATTNVTGLVSEVYRIKKVLYATSYNWFLNRGTNASITHINAAGVNDTAVIVTFASCFVKDTLSVKSVSPCSISSAKTVIMSASTTPATVSVIGTQAGDFAVCIGSSKSFTAIPNTPSATQTAIAKYRWTVPANSIITSATTDSATITVLFNTGFTGGSISVKGISSCNVVGTTATTSVLQFLPPTPASIGSSTNSYNACINSSVTYTAIVGTATTSQAPATSFRWTRPNNTSITSASSDSSSITVRFNTGYTGGAITVKSQSRCGTLSAARTQALTHTGCAIGTKMSQPITTSNNNSFEVSLYPNPTANAFKLLIKNSKASGLSTNNAIVKVIDIQGRMIKSFTTNTNQVTAIGNELKAGVYMVELRLGDEVRTIRAVKF